MSQLGLYLTKLKMPTQDAALIHDDGSAFTKNTLTGKVDVVVPSPSSYKERALEISPS
jgi:cytochrome oxidase Cu insertion factor (SCO1/SenC/PrrC family)